MELVYQAPQEKKQKGLFNTSVVLSPILYNYNQYLGKNQIDEGLKDMPFVFGKILSVPNASKGRYTYQIQYDQSKVSDSGNIDQYTKELPNINYVKDLLREAVSRADSMNYCFDGNKNRKPKNKSAASTKTPEQAAHSNASSPNLSGILSELSPGSLSFNFPSNSSQITINSPPINNPEHSDSDEESNADMNESAFYEPKEEEEQIVETNEEEIDVLGDHWTWNQWEEIVDDASIPGPKETNHYNGPHGIKQHVASSFKTVLQCIFSTTAMDLDFFKRLATQSNKNARTIMHT